MLAALVQYSRVFAATLKRRPQLFSYNSSAHELGQLPMQADTFAGVWVEPKATMVTENGTGRYFFGVSPLAHETGSGVLAKVVYNETGTETEAQVRLCQSDWVTVSEADEFTQTQQIDATFVSAAQPWGPGTLYTKTAKLYMSPHTSSTCNLRDCTVKLWIPQWAVGRGWAVTLCGNSASSPFIQLSDGTTVAGLFAGTLSAIALEDPHPEADKVRGEWLVDTANDFSYTVRGTGSVENIFSGQPSSSSTEWKEKGFNQSLRNTLGIDARNWITTNYSFGWIGWLMTDSWNYSESDWTALPRSTYLHNCNTSVSLDIDSNYRCYLLSGKFSSVQDDKTLNFVLDYAVSNDLVENGALRGYTIEPPPDVNETTAPLVNIGLVYVNYANSYVQKFTVSPYYRVTVSSNFYNCAGIRTWAAVLRQVQPDGEL